MSENQEISIKTNILVAIVCSLVLTYFSLVLVGEPRPLHTTIESIAIGTVIITIGITIENILKQKTANKKTFTITDAIIPTVTGAITLIFMLWWLS